MKKLLILLSFTFLITLSVFAQTDGAPAQEEAQTAATQQSEVQPALPQTESAQEQAALPAQNAPEEAKEQQTAQPQAMTVPPQEKPQPAVQNISAVQQPPVQAVVPQSQTQEQPIAEEVPQNTKPAFSAADLYNRGDYLGAAAAYENQLKQNSFPSPYVFYNLANSYFKSGDPDKAIVNYYRAFKLLPRDKDIKRNLAFALNSTGQHLLPEGVPQIAFDAFYLLSASELRGTLWLLGWIFAIAFASFMLGYKKDFCKKAVAVSGVLFMGFGIWYITRVPGDSSPLAVVVVSRAEVRSGPGENFPVSLSVPRAHLVTISDGKGAWTAIEIPSEKANGWVLKKSIEEI